MAGESPDMSEQQKSSGDPAEVPVPAPSSGGGDPRLAVAREVSIRVDQPTAVFATRARREASSATENADTAGSSDTRTPADADAVASGGSGDGESANDGADAVGDARLRAAVAAWVTGADAEGSGSERVSAAGAAGADADADHAADAGEEPGESAADAGSAAAAADEPAQSADARRDAEAEPKSRSAAEAAGPRPAAGAEPEPEPESEPESMSADAADAGDGKPSTADGAGSLSAIGADADSETEGDAGSAADADSRTDDGSGADAAVETGSADDAPSGSDTPADADADAEPADTGDRGDSGPGVDQATAVFRTVRPPVDQPTTMLKIGGRKPGEKAADGRAAEPGGDEKRSDGAQGAPSDRKSGPAGGDAARGAGRRKDEPDAERASKFVALKPLDEPAAAKKPGAPAPAPTGSAVPGNAGPERTAQQPLPPRPPLDLLAELTNTPPPPETPLRTVVRRVKIWTPLVILLVIVFGVVQAVRPLPTPVLTLTADSKYAFDGGKVSLPWPKEGQGWMDVTGLGTMDEFGEQKSVPIGSVAKAMTAYVALQDHPLKSGANGPSITVDATAQKEGGYDADGESTLNTVKEGDKLSEKDALAAIMIPSANNIARLLARWDAGSEEAFVKKMNATAKKLGMTNTTYTDPSGLKETTVSTAEDQVKLGNELVKIKALTDITKLPTWKDPSGTVWQNYNRLVPYDNAIGIKTGSTTKAGGNLLFAATKEVGGETVTVVGAVLGQHTPPIIDTVNAVSKTAMLAAQEALKGATILKKGDVVGYVDDGLGGHTPVVVTKDVSAVGWAGLTVRLKLGDDGTTVPHTAKAGAKVGVLSVGDGSGTAVEVPIALRDELKEPAFSARLTRLR
ncbi:D-alanyl-D-alanine carboxypeptidase [Streptomyces sp. NPDC002577]